MKKIFIVFSVVVGLSIIFIPIFLRYWYEGWRDTGANYHTHTPEFIVEVTDQTSGKPISGVLIQLEWVVRDISPWGLLHASHKTLTEVWFMTDEEGKAYIPTTDEKNWRWGFTEILYRVRHPFYQYESGHLFRGGAPKETFENNYVKEFPLLSLSVKHKDSRCPDPHLTPAEMIKLCRGAGAGLFDDIRRSGEYYSWPVHVSEQKIKGFDSRFYISTRDAEQFILNVSKTVFPINNIGKQYERWISNKYTKRK